MTSLAVAENGTLTPLEGLAKPVRDRIRQGRQYRRTYMEPTWQLNLAYASGKQWLGWHDSSRTLRTIQELDPRYKGRELYTADVITEYRTTALGELGSDNDLPQLLLRSDDQFAEEYQAQLNRALEYGWDHEWDGDDVLAQVDRFVVDLGTAAVRCRYDSAQGPLVADNVPHLQGLPVLDPQQAMGLMADGPNPDVTMQPLRQGRICWEPLSCFDLIVPPGAVHERQFPWECVVRPAYLPDVQERYGDIAAQLKEDNDISTGLGLSTMSPTSSSGAVYAVTDARSNRLRDHVWLFDFYERPTKASPQGRTFTFASNDLKLIDHAGSLPYQAPDGTWRSGIAYFHWWRVTGRFWSRSLVDVLRDGQRGINKRRTQINEIIDRNMPFVIVQTDSKAKRKSGLVNEIVEVDPQERAPQVVQGTGPGQWMQADIEAMREDLVHASGINGPRRGENPQNVTTYSQLSLINELDTTKREQIYLERRRAIGRLVEDTVSDIRTYWGPAKQIALAGDERIEPFVFDSTKIPPFFVVKIGKGTAKPRSQAAELQKITDLWTAALNAQAAMQNPGVWVRWYKESLEAGVPLELPAEGVEDPGEKAELENHYLQQGVPMPIAYYDIHQAHLVRHRLIQDQAMFAQDMKTWQIVEQHCQLHMNAMAVQAQQQMLQQAAMLPGPPGGPSPGPSGAPGPGQASPPAPPGPVTPARGPV